MKNREELAKHFKKLGFKKGAEVGVYLGYYSRILLDTIPGLELLCVDWWKQKTYRERAYPVVLETMSKYPGAKVIRGKSVKVAKTVEDESLDFVFIDADHSYEAVKEDIEAWTPKVRMGGIVSGHDYYVFRSGNDGVIRAVDEFVKDKYKLKLTDKDNDNPHKDSRQQCWYFLKE